MSALGHVWTASWQELSDVGAALVGCGHVSGLLMRLSRAMKNAKCEKYCRLRAWLQLMMLTAMPAGFSVVLGFASGNGLSHQTVIAEKCSKSKHLIAQRTSRSCSIGSFRTAAHGPANSNRFWRCSSITSTTPARRRSPDRYGG
jgi:hypothetical protein